MRGFTAHGWAESDSRPIPGELLSGELSHLLPKDAELRDGEYVSLTKLELPFGISVIAISRALLSTCQWGNVFSRESMNNL